MLSCGSRHAAALWGQSMLTLNSVCAPQVRDCRASLGDMLHQEAWIAHSVKHPAQGCPSKQCQAAMLHQTAVSSFRSHYCSSNDVAQHMCSSVQS